MNSTSIKYWTEDDRPSYRAYNHGISSLSDSEVLSLVLGSRCAKLNVIQLSGQVLKESNNNFYELARKSTSELKKIRGIGNTKAMRIQAIFELAKRIRSQSTSTKHVSRSEDVNELFRGKISQWNKEEFHAMYLNRRNNVISIDLINIGGIDIIAVDPIIIIKKAILKEACNIILCHTHPSGSLEPSKPDIHLTDQLKEGAKLMNIDVLDHLILSQKDYYSFADNYKI